MSLKLKIKFDEIFITKLSKAGSLIKLLKISRFSRSNSSKKSNYVITPMKATDMHDIMALWLHRSGPKRKIFQIMYDPVKCNLVKSQTPCTSSHSYFNLPRNPCRHFDEVSRGTYRLDTYVKEEKGKGNIPNQTRIDIVPS